MTRIPSFIPKKIAKSLEGRSFSRELPPAIKAALRTPKKIKVSEHAEKYRIVTEEPHPGPWRRIYAPHSVQIMDTFCLPHIKEIWFCGPEQGAAKTSTMLCCLHWAAHISPGNIFYLVPDKESARKVIGKKIRPMIEASRCLAKVITEKKDDLSLRELKLGNGVTIIPAWANSPSSMAMFAAKVAFGDEIDKGTELSGRETDRVRLIRKRLRLYGKRGKGFFSSTPAGLFIYKGVYDCPQVFEYRVTCPDCGKLEKMDISQVWE